MEAERKVGWQLCWMRIRRNFFEAQSSNPDLAGKALEYIGQIYKLERVARGDPPDKRLLKRLNKSKPGRSLPFCAHEVVYTG